MLEDPNPGARCAAVKKLTDQTLLAKVITPSSPALVKTGRVYKLNSPQQETEEQLKERNERAEKRKAIRESNLVQGELPLKKRKPRPVPSQKK